MISDFGFSISNLSALNSKCKFGSTGAAIALAVSTVEDPRGYGRVLVDENGSVRAVVEESAASPSEREIKKINAGVYCFANTEAGDDEYRRTWRPSSA